MGAPVPRPAVSGSERRKGLPEPSACRTVAILTLIHGTIVAPFAMFLVFLEGLSVGVASEYSAWQSEYTLYAFGMVPFFILGITTGGVLLFGGFNSGRVIVVMFSVFAVSYQLPKLVLPLVSSSYRRSELDSLGPYTALINAGIPALVLLILSGARLRTMVLRRHAVQPPPQIPSFMGVMPPPEGRSREGSFRKWLPGGSMPVMTVVALFGVVLSVLSIFASILLTVRIYRAPADEFSVLPGWYGAFASGSITLTALVGLAFLVGGWLHWRGMPKSWVLILSAGVITAVQKFTGIVAYEAVREDLPPKIDPDGSGYIGSGYGAFFGIVCTLTLIVVVMLPDLRIPARRSVS